MATNDKKITTIDENELENVTGGVTGTKAEYSATGAKGTMGAKVTSGFAGTKGTMGVRGTKSNSFGAKFFQFLGLGGTKANAAGTKITQGYGAEANANSGIASFASDEEEEWKK